MHEDFWKLCGFTNFFESFSFFAIAFFFFISESALFSHFWVEEDTLTYQIFSLIADMITFAVHIFCAQKVKQISPFLTECIFSARRHTLTFYQNFHQNWLSLRCVCTKTKQNSLF